MLSRPDLLVSLVSLSITRLRGAVEKNKNSILWLALYWYIEK